MPESERESATADANSIIENFGEINQIIMANRLDTSWGDNFNLIINGVETFVFGAIVDNNTKMMLAEDKDGVLEIKEVISLDNNPPVAIKDQVCKKSGIYDTYVLKNAPIDADYVILIDLKNEKVGKYIYIKEIEGSFGEVAAISLQQNDTTINVTLNGENKIIDSTFYKITDSNGNIFYLDNSKEKLYMGPINSDIGVEEGKEIIEIEKSNYDIRNVGYIIND